MANKNGRTGAEWETRLAAFFNRQDSFRLPTGFEVQRAPRWGAADKGDLLNTRDFCIEAKAGRNIDLSGFLNEAIEEAKNAGKRFGVVVIKRRNHKTEQAYVVMQLDQFSDLLSDYHSERS